MEKRHTFQRQSHAVQWLSSRSEPCNSWKLSVMKIPCRLVVEVMLNFSTVEIDCGPAWDHELRPRFKATFRCNIKTPNYAKLFFKPIKQQSPLLPLFWLLTIQMQVSSPIDGKCSVMIFFLFRFLMF